MIVAAFLFALPAANAAPLKSLAELRKAVSTVKPGDEIVLADGAYADAGSIKITGGGTPQNPVTIRAATPGGVTFAGDAQFRVEASHVVLSGFRFINGKPASNSGVFILAGDNNRITECAIIDYNLGQKSDGPGSTFWVALRGQRNRVDHCLFKHKTTQGVLLFVQRPTDAPDHSVIDHNVFRDIPAGSGNGYETIRIGTSHKSQSDSFSAVFENYFENCDGEIEIISVKSGKNVIHQNTFVNCQGSLTLRHGAQNTATGNLFFVTDPEKADTCGLRINDRDHVIENNYIAGVRTKNKHRGGIVLMSSEGEGQLEVYRHWRVKDNVLRRNTIIDCQQSLVYGGGAYGTPPLSAAFEQNLIARPLGDIITAITEIVKPTYHQELYVGAPLGLPSTPAGIDQKTDPRLESTTINGYTLWFPAGDMAVGADPKALKPLRESDVGTSYKN